MAALAPVRPPHVLLTSRRSPDSGMAWTFWELGGGSEGRDGGAPGGLNNFAPGEAHQNPGGGVEA